jgi:hypothetical protein
MSEFTGETLYNLLPAIYRTRDAVQGWPLRALLGLIETQVVALEGDIERLYDNWFIETCDEWAVPYIGDLLDVRQLRPIPTDAGSSALFTRRGYVANTLAYRRAKGTRGLLEKLAQDVAGWPCVAVEFFQLLATTQNVNHVRPANRRTVCVRDPVALELVGGPFETAAHTLEVRRAAGERGRYNVPSVGLYLWRLSAEVLEDVAAVTDAGGGERWRMNPLGADLRLFNRRHTSSSFDARNQEPSVPGPLRRLAFHADLEAVRQALAETGTPGPSSYLGDDPAVIVRLASEAEPIPAAQIAICNLDDWKLPPPQRQYTRKDGTTVNLPIRVALDPETGRIAFPAGTTPAAVRASLSYGFAGPIGGGTFSRTLSALGDRALYTVAGGGGALGARLATWAVDQPDEALVEIQDSLTYDLPSALSVPADLKLEIRAASSQRPLIAAAAPATPWKIGLAHQSVLRLDGVAIAAGLEVAGTGDAMLAIADATLVPGLAQTPTGDPAQPGSASVIGTETGGTLTVEIQRSIVGAIRLPLEDPTSSIVSESAVVLADSIVDGTGGPDKAIIAGSATIDRSTVFGASAFTVLSYASDSLFTAPVTVDRTQEGCCRFSFLPDGSKVPRAYRCQPRLAFKDTLAIADPMAREAAQRAILSRVQPSFSSERYGDPGYAQLDRGCTLELRLGAEDESEMGAFHFLHQPQREANLRAAVDEYLRFGLEAGLFFVT